MLPKPLYTGALAKYKYHPRIHDACVFYTKFGDKVDMARIQGEYIYVPRAMAPVGDKDIRVRGARCKFSTNFKPRDVEQKRIVDEATDLLNREESFIIQAATGIGKTVIACQLIHNLGRKALVVVTKDDLMKQWVSEFKAVLNLRDEDIGIIKQNTCDVLNKKVVVASIHSLAKRGKYPASIRKEFGIIVFDECHSHNAPTFCNVCGMFPALLRLGLSATPERSDGRELIFTSHVGPVRIVSNGTPMVPKVLMVNSGWSVPTKTVSTGSGYIERPIPHQVGRITLLVKIMCQSNKRNERICKYIKMAYDKDRNVVVFSDSIDHLHRLHRFLIEGGIPGSDIGFYIGSGMTQKKRDEDAKRRVVLATYGMSKEGTNKPWWDTAVLATPRANVKQIVGRVLRLHPGKKQPLVIDICDNGSKVLSKYTGKRERVYYELNSEIRSYG